MQVTRKSRLFIRIQNIAFVALFLAAVGLAAWLSTRYVYEADWTAGSRNTLSEASRKLLATLSEPVQITAYVREKEGEPNATPPNTGTWKVFTYVGDQMLTPKGQAAETPITQTYDTKGALVAPTTITFEDFIPVSGAAAQGIKLDLTGSTQTAAAAAVSNRVQDGVAVGQLVGITVDDAGIIKASYSNSDIVPPGGKLLLVSVREPVAPPLVQ